MTGMVHIIGAGVAGLAAAVELTAQGVPVRLYEANAHAGGRCRSFYEPKLDRLIDNGNHLLLSGNYSALRYLARIGAKDTLHDVGEARFDFCDVQNRVRWSVRMDEGRLPLWMLDPKRRVPDTRAKDYLTALKLVKCTPSTLVADVIKPGSLLYKRFWGPLVLGVLNARADEAAAELLGAVFKETVLKGGKSCHPLIPKQGLGPSFIDPALAYLKAKGAEVRLNCRVVSLEREDNRIRSIRLSSQVIDLEEKDTVVLTGRASHVSRLVPQIRTPANGAAILNIHFKLVQEKQLPEGPFFIGLINSVGHWLFVRSDLASVTISAADALAQMPEEAVIDAVWREVREALGLAMPIYSAVRVIKEKFATFDPSPEGVARRPEARTAWRNLFLAGDYTDTGLPSTIEGSIRSGQVAAELAINSCG